MQLNLTGVLFFDEPPTVAFHAVDGDYGTGYLAGKKIAS